MARRSNRLVTKNITYTIDSETEDVPETLKKSSRHRLRNKSSADYKKLDSDATPTQKIDGADKTWTLEDEDDSSTFTSMPTDELSDMEDSIFDTPTPKPPTRANLGRPARRAAQVAARKVKEIVRQPLPPPAVSPKPTEPPKWKTFLLDDKTVQELNQKARDYVYQRPAPPKLNPLPISRDRLVIDQWNVLFYAENGAIDLWASAFSSTRFAGPRRHAPFRELHRLTDPGPMDVSHWAENIRWAKEQWRLYGTVWLEYDFSLETITEHRKETLWCSEELIAYGPNLDWLNEDASNTVSP